MSLTLEECRFMLMSCCWSRFIHQRCLRSHNTLVSEEMGRVVSILQRKIFNYHLTNLWNWVQWARAQWKVFYWVFIVFPKTSHFQRMSAICEGLKTNYSNIKPDLTTSAIIWCREFDMWCLFDIFNKKKQTSLLHIRKSSWAQEKKKFNKSDAMAAADALWY